MKSRGFTLVEILVVVTIIAVLLALGAIGYRSFLAASDDARRLADMQRYEEALAEYYLDNGFYPGTAQGVSGSGEYLGDSEGVMESLLAPYMTEVPADPRWDPIACDNDGDGVPNPSAAGTLSSCQYFYAYDPLHNVDFCTGTNLPNQYPLIGFNSADSDTFSIARDTCSGDDMNLNDAVYNRAFGTDNL